MAKQKVTIVVEYDIEEEYDEDEVFKSIIVDKVLLNGKEVNRSSPTEDWPILHIGGDYLDLQLTSD